MEFESLALLAKEYKRSGKYNCCQAVLLALKEDTGLAEEELLSIGSGFCAGMGDQEATCGALIGVGIACGLFTKGKMTLRYNKEIKDNFVSKCGALACKDLKKLVDGKPVCPCDMCVYHAMRAYYEVLHKYNLK